MLLSILLAASAAITFAQSDAADAVAKAYLTQACSDGRERVGAVTAADGVFHDLSLNGSAYSVGMDEPQFRGLCTKSPLIVYHCHTANINALGPFPGLGEDGESSDFGHIAFLEFMCAEESEIPPVIEYRIVHTGGSGGIIRYGLRGNTLERARGLGRQIAQTLETVQNGPLIGKFGLPDMRAITSAPAVMRGLHEGLNEHYQSIFMTYGSAVLGHLKSTCPWVKAEADMNTCPAFTLDSFVSTMDPCSDYIIIPPGAAEQKTCKAATGERIIIAPQYTGWTELTPANYDTFTRIGSVVVAFCDNSGTGSGKPCGVFLSDLDRELPACSQLSRGYVDGSRDNNLRDRHDAGLRDAILLQNGRRYDINLKNPSPQMKELIICGAETLFKGFPGFD